jgi:hypothetical protein
MKYLSYDKLESTSPNTCFLLDFKELFNNEMEVNRENIDALRFKLNINNGWNMMDTFGQILNKENFLLYKEYMKQKDIKNYIDVFIELYPSGNKASLVDKIVKACS